MRDYLDCEKNPIHMGQHVAVWDNWYKKMFRCEVIGFTPQKVKFKPINSNSMHITQIKYPSDLMIIKK